MVRSSYEVFKVIRQTHGSGYLTWLSLADGPACSSLYYGNSLVCATGYNYIGGVV